MNVTSISPSAGAGYTLSAEDLQSGETTTVVRSTYLKLRWIPAARAKVGKGKGGRMVQSEGYAWGGGVWSEGGWGTGDTTCS